MELPITATRTRRAALWAFAALAVAAAVYFVWPRPHAGYPPVVAAGLRLIDCEARADADCMYEFVTDDEKKAYRLTKEKWRWLINDYGKTIRWAKPAPGGKVSYYGNEANGSVMVSRPALVGSGKPGYAIARIARTDEGYKSPSLATKLIDGIPVYRLRTDDLPDHDNAEATIAAYRRDEALLKAHGFHGVLREGKLVTWRERIVRYEANKAQSGPGGP